MNLDNDEEAINIIGRHLMEFSEMIYDHNYLMIAKKEINRNLGIYLMPFEDSCRLETTLKAIEDLIEIKRQESDNETYLVPSKRIVPEVKMIHYNMVEMVDRMEKSDGTTKKMSDNLNVLTPETEKISRNMSRMNEELNKLNLRMNKVDDTNDAIKTVQNETTKVQQTLEELKAQSTAKLNKMKKDFEATLENLQFFQKQSIKREEKLYPLEVNRFYAQRNLEYIRSSPTILEKMCMRLSVKSYEDHRSKEPPFKYIISMEDKKKELIEYFDLLQKNLDDVNEKQINIRDWMVYNWAQILYKPTTSEKEEWKKIIEQELKVKNTIGTVLYIPFKWEKLDFYYFLCVANSKIICWNCGENKEQALKNVHENLKNVLKWDTNAKFATDIEVSDDLSDYFVHVSTDERMKISDNQKVVEWMINNFESLNYSFKECYHHSIPAIYNLALKNFEESIE